MRLIPLLTAIWCFASPAFSATLETDITPKMAEMGCTARLSGVIEEGDLERIQPFLETPLSPEFGDPSFDEDIVFRRFSPALDYAPDGLFSHRLCLNSPGGSLSEAIRIIDYFRKASTGNGSGWGGIQTAVAEGDHCESACAYVFLAGRFVRFTGNENYEGRSNHLLHPLGRLGFHAPFIEFRDSAYSGETVREIWRIGMEATSLISRQIANGNIFMPNALFSEMLTYPPSDMLVPETVGQAVRWRIDVEPNVLNYGVYPYSRETFFESVCLNSAAYAANHFDLQRQGNALRMRQDGEVMRSTGAFVDTLTGRPYECEIPVDNWERLQWGVGPNFEYSPSWMKRLRFNCANPRVKLVAQVDCYDCDIDVELGCMGVFPPDARITDIYMDPPQP